MGMKTHIIGDGVAAMMLASMADRIPQHEISILHPEGAPMARDHMLGFWNTEGLEFAVDCSRASWSKWSIVTNNKTSVMHSEKHAYHIMHKADFVQNARNEAEEHGVTFADQKAARAT